MLLLDNSWADLGGGLKPSTMEKSGAGMERNHETWVVGASPSHSCQVSFGGLSVGQTQKIKDVLRLVPSRPIPFADNLRSSVSLKNKVLPNLLWKGNPYINIPSIDPCYMTGLKLWWFFRNLFTTDLPQPLHISSRTLHCLLTLPLQWWYLVYKQTILKACSRILAGLSTLICIYIYMRSHRLYRTYFLHRLHWGLVSSGQWPIPFNVF